MALSLQSANLVWQKAQIALDSLSLRGVVREQILKLKAHLSQVGGNPDLQFVAIADLTADVVAADAACQLYAVVLKKRATATDAFYKAFNDAATDSSAEDALLAIGLLEAGDYVVLTFPGGMPFSAGLVHGSYTAIAGAAGTTASTSGDGPDGFLIIGS